MKCRRLALFGALIVAGFALSVPGAYPAPLLVGPGPSSAEQSAESSKRGVTSCSQTFPIEVYGNRLYLQVRVNGNGPFRFALDTGAAFCVINRTRSAELGLRAIDTGHSQSAGAGENKTRIAIAKEVTLSVPGMDLRLKEIVALPFDDVEPFLGGPVYGALGYDVFERYAVVIDYVSATVSLCDSKSFVYSGIGEAIPISVNDRVPKVAAKIGVSGLKPLDGALLVDTGMGGPLELNSPYVRNNGLLQLAARGAPVVSGGVGGTFRSTIGRVDGIQVGSKSFANPVVVFSLAKNGASASDKQSGNIGGAILRRFKVIFDYSHKHMILEPSTAIEEPFEADMSGSYLVAENPDFRTIKVSRVFDRTPASDAGLREGDVIESIDGKPAAELKLEGIRQKFKIDGQEYVLGIRRSAETLTIKLKPRRLV